MTAGGRRCCLDWAKAARSRIKARRGRGARLAARQGEADAGEGIAASCDGGARWRDLSAKATDLVARRALWRRPMRGADARPDRCSKSPALDRRRQAGRYDSGGEWHCQGHRYRHVHQRHLSIIADRQSHWRFMSAADFSSVVVFDQWLRRPRMRTLSFNRRERTPSSIALKLSRSSYESTIAQLRTAHCPTCSTHVAGRMQRILAQALSAAGTDGVAGHPWAADQRPDPVSEAR